MLYDYYCKDCDLVFEVSKPFSEYERIEPCPECGTSDTRQYFSSTVPFVYDSVGIRKKIPQGFKEGVLDRIKRHYPMARDNFKD